MNKTEKDRPSLLWLLIAIVVSIIAIAWYLIDYNISSNEIRGQFGDKFGSVNALFSGLAFAGLIYTIVLQRKDLQLQKKDLELTRKELEGQKKEAQKQNATLSKQEFNTMYFHFLNTNRNIVNEVNSKFTGQHFIRRVYEDLERKNNNPPYLNDKRYMETYQSHRENLSCYFKSLHNLFYFTNNSLQLSRSEKSVYFRILMSQLSDYEIMLLFYDNIYRKSDHLIKVLIEEYSLFYQFPYDLLISEVDKTLYEDSAYGV